MNSAGFSFPSLRVLAASAAAVALGAGALTVPWLTVRVDLSGKDRTDPALAEIVGLAEGATQGGGSESRHQDKRPPSLLLFPQPVAPPAPRIAADSADYASRVPDTASVLELEQRLRALSYLAGPEDGILDESTRFGLSAFQKVENLPRTGQPDAPTLARLEAAQPPAPAYPTPSEHLEVDIARQVVFVVRAGRVTETLPTSTGNNKVFRSQGRRSRAVTPNGQYAITYKRNGWRRSPLGLLYRPAYFNGGIAFHGAKSVPTSPASHGCVRLPMPFADWFADHASPVGMPVYVYGNPGEPNPPPMATAPASAPISPSPEGAWGEPPAPPPAAPPPQDPGPLIGGLLG